VILVGSALLAACAGSGPGTGGASPGPSGVLTKEGGDATTTVKASLATVIDNGIDEQDFADTLRSLSGGSFDVAVTPNWRQGDLNSETDLIKDVVDGKAELGISGIRAFDTVGVDSFAGLEAPFLIDSYNLEASALSSDWGQKLLEGTRSAGVVSLDYVQGPLRLPLGLTRNLVQATDFVGARIGIRPSHVSEMTIRALGATPVAWATTTGLDGIEMDPYGVAGNKYDVGATSLTGNAVFWARPSVIFANAKWFDSLSATQQDQLRTAAAGVDQRSATRIQGQERDGLGLLCARGFPVTLAPMQALDDLRTRTQSVTAELEKDPATKATIDAVNALRTRSGSPDVAGPCPEAAASPSLNTGVTPLDGKWHTSFTKADLIASPLLFDSGEINDGNWGDWTFTFENGRVSYTQSNNVEHGSSSGTFTVSGDTVTLAMSTGDNAGETFAFRWSIYKNTLTFKRDATLGVGPTPMLVKSWTRVP
jgi:TRAP-type C4-dicarboxylate transport system substrate-binding protein